MFLAVTASLLGYCQTDEKGKTQRSPIPLLPHRLILLDSVERNTDFAFRIAPLGRMRVKGREDSAMREKERRRLTFIAAGISSSCEFTYSASGLMSSCTHTYTCAHIHRRALLIVRETVARYTRRGIPS